VQDSVELVALLPPRAQIARWLLPWSERGAGGGQRPPVSPGRQIGGFAAARAAGWQSANMTRLLVFAAISRTIASVKLPPTVDAPIGNAAFGGRPGLGRLVHLP
jgi:hypothetical protein